MIEQFLSAHLTILFFFFFGFIQHLQRRQKQANCAYGFMNKRNEKIEKKWTRHILYQNIRNAVYGWSLKNGPQSLHTCHDAKWRAFENLLVQSLCLAIASSKAVGCLKSITRVLCSSLQTRFATFFVLRFFFPKWIIMIIDCKWRNDYLPELKCGQLKIWILNQFSTFSAPHIVPPSVSSNYLHENVL